MEKRTLWREKSKEEIAEALHKIYEQNTSECPVMNMRSITKELIRDNCGECVICREGVYQLHVQTDNIVNGRASEDTLDIIKQLSEVMQEISLCDYGKEVGKRTERAIEADEETFVRHIKRKRCDFKVCEKLSNFVEPAAPIEGGLMGSKARRRKGN